MIASLFVFVVILVLSIPSALVFIPLAVITGNVGPLYAVTCFIVRTGFRAAGIRVRVEGRENVPAGRACIFMANHVSNLDPPGLIPRIPGRTAGFAKRSVFNIPIFGYCMKLGEFIPVDRTGSVSRRAGERGHRRADSRKGRAHHNLRRGHAVTGWTAASLQERALLPGNGNRRTMHSCIDLRNGSADGGGQFCHQARHGALRLSRANLPSEF